LAGGRSTNYLPALDSTVSFAKATAPTELPKISSKSRVFNENHRLAASPVYFTSPQAGAIQLAVKLEVIIKV